MNDDLDIRKRFAAMRAEDSARIPGFEHVLLQRARTKPYRLGLSAAAACLLLAAGVATLLHRSHQTATSARAAPALAHWRAPTDFLLNTPGRELLYTIPQIGESFSDQLIVVPDQEPHS